MIPIVFNSIYIKFYLKIKLLNQGCKLSDLSLRSQTICHTADILTTFFIYAKNHHISTSYNKTPSKTPRIPVFLVCFAKKLLWVQTKTGRVPRYRCHFLRLGRFMVCGNAYVEHFAKFPDFFEAQCWQPCVKLTRY